MKQAPIKTRHLQVADEIRAQIRCGALSPGDRLPSYNELRAQQGVHTNTLEKAYASLELEGLIVRRRGSGTFVAQTKAATPAKTGIIGLSGKGFSFVGYSPYWAQLQGGAHEAATRAGMQLLILNPEHSQGWEKADGVLLCDWNDPLIPRKDLPGLQRVSLLTLIEDMASVGADDYNGMQIAVAHLLSLGHRKIAYLHGDPDSQIAGNRLAAYQTALKAAHIRPNAVWTRLLHGKYDGGARVSYLARKEIMRWLKDDWSTLGCTALLCHNDEAAVGAIQAFSENGIRVPQDVSVMGFDGTDYCDLVSPQLSSVQLPLREIGAQAVQLLLKQIAADKAIVKHRVLPAKLRMGESVAPASQAQNLFRS